MNKTQDEIQALKDNWVKDPIWDIETTDGFEDHYAELLAFRAEQELKWQIEAKETIANRARVIAVDTGITSSGTAQSIKTYQEIERSIEQYGDVAIAQVRATLLLAAQVQRIADALDQQIENEEAESHQDFMTRLYKVE
jgi:uncharacterized iron-regulated protein